MRGWYCSTAAGGLEKNLTLRSDLPVPALPTSRNAAHVLIQSLSVSLNPADYKVPEIPAPIRTALLRLPATPGMDFCGRIVSLTPAAQAPPHSLSVGDIVFGRLDPQQHGTLAEYFPAPAVNCTKLPSDLIGKLTPDQLTCLGVAGLTSYQAIAPHVEAGKGEKVFINGGAGGCGTMAIQIAKALGCHVTVSCSPAKEALCKRLGADEVIDYTQGKLVEELKKKGKVFSLVVDNAMVPKELYKAADEFLIPGKSFVQVGGTFSREAVGLTMGRLFWPRLLGGGRNPFEMFMIRNGREDAEQLARWVVEGKLEVVIEEVFEFEKVREAFEKLKSGRCYGKLVVRVGK
ncbi:hypothetical protein B0T14DRAFT_538103 [Immersiella caudata]|uniref:Enoyl reductase (ER) domain-containing protein n=1 Tax=Immersiella caudata TaxID=314043 RepID=A0AA39WSL5_9PEZI|nr:hypothetical protein B0T14DRAFT_538103 [Immersiella caudata]